jgi:hypothetical protein
VFHRYKIIKYDAEISYYTAFNDYLLWAFQIQKQLQNDNFRDPFVPSFTQKYKKITFELATLLWPLLKIGKKKKKGKVCEIIELFTELKHYTPHNIYSRRFDRYRFLPW